MPDTTNNKKLIRPFYNEFSGEATGWSGPINTDWDYIDAAFGDVTNLTQVSDTHNLSEANYRNLVLQSGSTLTGNVRYNIPSAVGGQWIVRNATNGPFTFTIGTTNVSGTTVVIPQGQAEIVYSDKLGNIRLARSTAAPSSSLSTSTTISEITASNILYNNGGFLGGLGTSGSGNVALVTNATMTGTTISNAASVRVGTATPVSGGNESVSILCPANTGGALVRLNTDTNAYFAGFNAGNFLTFNVNGNNLFSGPDLAINSGFSAARARFVNNTDWASEFYNYSSGAAGNGAAVFRVNNISNALAGFCFNGPTIIGNITTNGSAVSYNTSSDRRLKENIQPVTGTTGLSLVAQLRPVTFEWINNPALGEVLGFIADEVQQVIPQAVTGQSNAVDAEGNPVYQGIDLSKLVPVLTAALQEAATQINALSARVAALEAKA